MKELASHLGISLFDALGVVVSASVLYVAVAVVLRIWGRRVSTTASTGSIALITLVGAIAARSTLGQSPTLAGGLIAIGTLVVLERVFGRWSPAIRLTRRRRKGRFGPAAVVLMAAGEMRHDEIRRAGLSEPGLWALLRQRGIGHREDVALVVLEPKGAVTVIRSDQRLERAAVVGVQGAEDLPGELFSD
ncbi:DUF421 domain-containing protein [Phycicoccus sp. CSK15P-2]|uniref:YetF domain-containing protein n=1 Tax=Phycicoccus sp. CSK15P-2 TaxID=2807627 RepID=UPI0019500023|nr:YetF domain-containing protein [Phycicoccus sp. CSK15P-2]MBM6403335.1 DUF421 domain-containing protein [Phycicoccus sp. CSK15P-2]